MRFDALFSKVKSLLWLAAVICSVFNLVMCGMLAGELYETELCQIPCKRLNPHGKKDYRLTRGMQQASRFKGAGYS